MKVKKMFSVLAILTASVVFGATGSTVYPLPEGDPVYDGYAVTVDGVAAPVSAARCSAVPFNRRWPGHQRDISQSELCGFVRFSFTGAAKVVVEAKRDFEKFVIRPYSRGVKAVREGNRLTFDIVEPGAYSVEIDGYHNNLTLFADRPEEKSVKPDGKGVRFFGPGSHDIGITELKSGETVYVDAGAVVYGAFVCSNATDVAILGRGIIDMSRIKEKILFEVNATNNFAAVQNARRWHLVRMRNCRNVRIEGVTLRDSLCYNLGLYGCENLTVKDVKIIGQWRYNTDGIDLHNCRHARVSGCYVRTFDDSLCFKAHDGLGNTEDCIFEKCVVWNDWGKSLEVGVECRAEHLRNLVFRDIDVIHHITAPMEVANVDYGTVSDVTFENIRVELDDRIPPGRLQKTDADVYDTTLKPDPEPAFYTSPIVCHAEYSTENGGKWQPGRIEGVRVKDIVLTGDVDRVCAGVYGIDESHRNSGLVFENVFLNGRRVAPERGNFRMHGGQFADWRFADPAVSGDVRLKGRIGETFDRMIEKHVIATDVDYITTLFKDHTEKSFWWQTEFWGKWMHVAPAFQSYSGSEKLRASIDRGVETILSAQEPGGYIGNYADDRRFKGCDLWGMKYTLLGLLHYYDGAKERPQARAALKAAMRLCDYIIAQVGPNGARGVELWQTGTWAGLASSSVLEPVMWLYRRVRADQTLGGEAAARKYLAFADYIVKGMTEPEKGPRLLDLAEKGIPVAGRNLDKKYVEGYVGMRSRLKAYEMMSCYQGILDYVEEKRDEGRGMRDEGRGRELDRLYRAAIFSAENIAKDEVNLAGSAASSEQWFGGAKKQHEPYTYQQEACVTITWMRLCEKLLAVTGDPKWADELEKSFYNAYLGALSRDGAEFAAYIPLSGSRYHGMHHCFMFTNCCTANGPRGFLSFLNQFFRDEGAVSTLNFYTSALVRGFEIYTLYPRAENVRIVSHRAGPHALRLRIPAWSAKTAVKVNGQEVAGAKAGTYFTLDRDWAMGDIVEIVFDMPVVAHTLANNVAFTRGPVLLARDSRFADGDLAEPMRKGWIKDGDVMTTFTPVRSMSDDLWMTFSATLPFGIHTENPEGQYQDTVFFCDYASAGNLWKRDNYYRTWFQVTKGPLD